MTSIRSVASVCLLISSSFVCEALLFIASWLPSVCVQPQMHRYRGWFVAHFCAGRLHQVVGVVL